MKFHLFIGNPKFKDCGICDIVFIDPKGKLIYAFQNEKVIKSLDRIGIDSIGSDTMTISGVERRGTTLQNQEWHLKPVEEKP
jgi:hypothetical protein